MTLFPVAQRELLAAARRPATHRVRIGSALFAAILAFFVLVFIGMRGAGRQGGQFLFLALWWGVQAFAVLAGTFLTADAIGEERRDGTLGLLFLTDLGGFELVLGKFVGAALNSAYGMAAVFPILATAWFLGGITDGEFWRALLVSLNTLFVSLGLGLLVSSFSRNQNRAVGTTVALQLFVQFGLPAVAAVAAHFQSTGRLPLAVPLDKADWISPAGAALRSNAASYALRPGEFWTVLGLGHAVGWMLLGAAGIVVAGNWREGREPIRLPAWMPSLGRRLAGRRRRLTPSQVDRNPAAALFCGTRRVSGLGWILAGTGVAVALASIGLALGGNGGNLSGFSMSVFAALFALFRGVFAWEAVAFFGEARRTGALDLALTTPLADHELLGGHSRRLWTQLGPQTCVLVIADFVAGLAGGMQLGILGIVADAAFVLELVAMLKLGAWLSLTERRPLVAFAKTLVFAGLLPSVLLLPCCEGVVIPPLVIAWADHRLRLPIRQVLSGARAPWQVKSGGFRPL
jgi:ABC-type transport system involved in multi-copper enzyme maturation permease subunit